MWSTHSPLGASLVEEVVADPRARMLAGVVGAGGTGKSALLDDLEHHYRAAGLPVSREFDEPEEGSVLLVDDAHRLAEPGIAALSRLVHSHRGSMVVAFRPSPVGALRELGVQLEREHPAVVLGPLTRDQVAAHLRSVLGLRVSDGLVEAVIELTSSMPWLVRRIAAATAGPGAAAPNAPVVSGDVLEEVRRELDSTGPELRQLLLALAVGFDLTSPLPPSAAMSPAQLDAAVLAGTSAGLMTPDTRLVPLVKRTLLETSPPYRVQLLQRELVDSYLSQGRPLDPIARDLARSGLHDGRVAQCLESLADHALPTEPALASELYTEAERSAAGADAPSLAARRAQAAYGTGDLDSASRIVDELIAADDPPDLARAIDTSAAVWAQRGALARSADMYSWLGPERVGASAPLAVVALVGAGMLPDARQMHESSTSSAPTQLGGALSAMAEGVLESLAGDQSVALASLVRASDMLTASRAAIPMPETPAALAALVAMHSGELAVAHAVLDAALAGGQGGGPARRRLLLLRAWSAMLAENHDQARELIARAIDGAGALPPRDQLLWHSLEVALARRSDDVGALLSAWQRARESLLHVPVDLFGLLPLGELVVAAARLRDSAWLQTHISHAWDLLAGLGDPPVWSTMLRWSAVQAGILLDRPSDLAPHAAALVRASVTSRLAAVLAAAGREWVEVLAGTFDAAGVESAARALATAGLPWDGSRLAGHAAARAVDRRDMSRLLSCARDLHPRPAAPHQLEPRPLAGRDSSGLSAREREVARLVLEGRTYREIGEAIFVSPRTAEHHIAQIRRRLGAAGRSDLLTKLRGALGQVPDDRTPDIRRDPGTPGRNPYTPTENPYDPDAAPTRDGIPDRGLLPDVGEKRRP